MCRTCEPHLGLLLVQLQLLLSQELHSCFLQRCVACNLRVPGIACISDTETKNTEIHSFESALRFYYHHQLDASTCSSVYFNAVL